MPHVSYDDIFQLIDYNDPRMLEQRRFDDNEAECFFGRFERVSGAITIFE